MLLPLTLLLGLMLARSAPPTVESWQACRWLRSSLDTTGIRVIALTGLAAERAEWEAMAAGFDRFIVKGPDPEHVVETIRELLGRG